MIKKKVKLTFIIQQSVAVSPVSFLDTQESEWFHLSDSAIWKHRVASTVFNNNKMVSVCLDSLREQKMMVLWRNMRLRSALQSTCCGDSWECENRIDNLDWTSGAGKKKEHRESKIHSFPSGYRSGLSNLAKSALDVGSELNEVASGPLVVKVAGWGGCMLCEHNTDVVLHAFYSPILQIYVWL